MNSFAIFDTVKTSFFVVKDHWRDVLRAAKWPAVAFIPAFGIYMWAFFLIGDPGVADPQIADFGQVTAMFVPLFLALIPLMLVVMAFHFNWQAFVMGPPASEGDASAGSGEPVGDATVSERDDWWSQFGLYILRQLQIIGVLLVPYLLFFVLFIYTAEGSPKLAFALFAVFFVCIIMLLPVVMRASLVFPAIAARLPEPTFGNAFDVSRGQGWRMVGAYFLMIILMQVLLMAVTLALFIVGGILAAVGGEIVASILGLILSVAMLFLYPALIAVYANIPALVLMQLLPPFEGRWQQLLNRETGDQGPPSDTPDTQGLEYGRSKKSD